MSESPGVRTTVKGILVRSGQVLLNRCEDPYNGVFYSLPGGGQRKYETLEETLRRELLEETGYRVRDIRLAGMFEEICDDEAYRVRYPDYCHKLYLFFLCTPEEDTPEAPEEPDSSQLSSDWIPIELLDSLPLQPLPLRSALKDMLRSDAPLFLGSEHHSLP